MSSKASLNAFSLPASLLLIIFFTMFELSDERDLSEPDVSGERRYIDLLIWIYEMQSQEVTKGNLQGDNELVARYCK